MAPFLLGRPRKAELTMSLNLAFKAFDVLVAALIFTTLG